eukprot:scaffold54691_cov44-Phaeocystis_antarctica.AAC.2
MGARTGGGDAANLKLAAQWVKARRERDYATADGIRNQVRAVAAAKRGCSCSSRDCSAQLTKVAAIVTAAAGGWQGGRVGVGAYRLWSLEAGIGIKVGVGERGREGGEPTWAIRGGRQVNTRIQSRLGVVAANRGGTQWTETQTFLRPRPGEALGSARSNIATGITWVILHKPSTRERGSRG